MCFVQTLQSLRLVARLRGSQDSMNLFSGGKIKFVERHYLKKILAPTSHYGQAQNYRN